MSPRRVQLRRTKGWRKPEGCVVVARPSRWGNPFVIGDGPLSFHGHEYGNVGNYNVGGGRADMTIPDAGLTAEQTVSLYRDVMADILLSDDPYDCEIVAALESLRGRDLACWCALDQPCHADVLLELANR